MCEWCELPLQYPRCDLQLEQRWPSYGWRRAQLIDGGQAIERAKKEGRNFYGGFWYRFYSKFPDMIWCHVTYKPLVVRLTWLINHWLHTKSYDEIEVVRRWSLRLFSLFCKTKYRFTCQCLACFDWKITPARIDLVYQTQRLEAETISKQVSDRGWHHVWKVGSQGTG